MEDLDGAHGSFKRGESMVEGAEDSDHAFGVALTLLQ